MPASVTSGFGMRKVKGRMRSPIARGQHHRRPRLGHGRALSHHERRKVFGGGKLARVEAAQLRQSGMGEVALEIACDPRDVSEITALAVTFRQSRKDAEDLRVPLSAERGVKRDEPIARKVLALRAPGGTVASEKLPFKRFRDVEPGILEQRHQVIGQRAPQRVLKVENADPL